tara:strand:+ start:112 stop:477 length:366 start_codon:yes stop_codon:yes gene_type:complete
LIIHFVNVLFSIITIEIFIFSKFLKLVRKILNNLKKLKKVILSKKISDRWKEKTVLSYSKNLFINSFKILIFLSLIISIFLILSFFFKDFKSWLFSFLGIIETTVIIIIYIKFRKFVNEKI